MSKPTAKELREAEVIELDSYAPNWRRKCGACGQSPTVEGVKDRHLVMIADLCGPCTFGSSDAVDPADWNRLG